MSDIDYGNPNSGIAICTLWTDRKRLIPKLHREHYGIIGNLYSSHGINYLFQTLLRNTHIRTLVLFGHCMTNSDEDLLRIWQQGVEDGRIPGTKVRVLLSAEQIDLVRKHVEIIDYRKRSLQELSEALMKMQQQTEPYADPINALFAEEERIETLPSPLSGHYIYEESVFAAWIKVLNYTLKFGDRKMTEYNEEQKEYNNLMVTIGKHIDIVEMGFREFFSPEELDRYYQENIRNTSSPQQLGISYTYGQRLFDFHGTDQIQYIIEKLGKRPYSRRAVAVLWQPEQDKDDDHGPCLNFLNCNIHNNEVYMSVLFRSNDVYNAWYKNVLGLMRLQQYIITQINEKFGTTYAPGKFTMNCVSAHIYQHNFRDAVELVEKNLHFLNRLIVDPKGLFVINLKEGKIEVEYRSNEGELIEIFSGKSGEELYKNISCNDLFSFFIHSAYLGYQIAKAEQCLKLGIPYVQDSAPESLAVKSA